MLAATCRRMRAIGRVARRPLSGGSGEPSSAATAMARDGGGAWEKLGLLPELASALRLNGFAEPSTPQQLAIKPLLEGRSVALAAQTGSGKTLAFLLPALQQIRQQELKRPVLYQSPTPNGKCRPRALVLVPTRDLVQQIHSVAKRLCAHDFRVRVRAVDGGATLKANRIRLLNGADLLVGTPQRILRLHAKGILSLRGVQHMIVDEVDDMLLRGFDSWIGRVLSKCPPRAGDPLAPQLTFVSATLGADVRHVLMKAHPDLQMLVSQCAHRAPSRLKHEIVPVSGDKVRSSADCHPQSRISRIHAHPTQSLTSPQHGPVRPRCSRLGPHAVCTPAHVPP